LIFKQKKECSKEKSDKRETPKEQKSQDLKDTILVFSLLPPSPMISTADNFIIFDFLLISSTSAVQAASCWKYAICQHSTEINVELREGDGENNQGNRERK
jgi:hypothetical protein